jgi:hypothetical protein
MPALHHHKQKVLYQHRSCSQRSQNYGNLKQFRIRSMTNAVWCRRWAAVTTVYLPTTRLMGDIHAGFLFWKWTAGSLTEHSSANMTAGEVPAWRSTLLFSRNVMRYLHIKLPTIRPWRYAGLATAFSGSTLPDFHMWGNKRNSVYECKMPTTMAERYNA